MQAHRLEEKLREKDLRLTESRKLVFEILLKARKAMTPKELHDSLTDKTDLASIYRNLTLFKDLGLIHSLSNGTYSVCQHDQEDHDHKHIHIITSCKNCGLTEEIKEHESELCEASKKLSGFSAHLNEVSSILLQGLCKACS